MPNFSARVTRTRDLTHDVREIEFTFIDPPSMAFTAGQFITFKVQKPGTTTMLNRAYSIASPPAKSTAIEIVLNLVPGGPGSTWLFSLQVGDEVSFIGPSGHFVMPADTTKDLLFVATGTGLAPFVSMVMTDLQYERDRKLTLIWGVRHEEDVYYQEELNALSAKHPRFTFITTVSRPTDAWTGVRGRVTKVVEDYVKSVDNLEAFCCGNSAMIADVTTILKAMGDVPVHKEQYYLDSGGR